MSTAIAPIVLVAAAVGAPLLTARVRDGRATAEVIHAPPVTSDMAVLAAIRELRLVVGSVTATRTDAPVGEGGPMAPLVDNSPPWRWYSAQYWAFGTARGWSKVGRRQVPLLTYADANAWLTQWSEAHGRWKAVTDALPEAQREAYRDVYAARRKAGDAVQAAAKRYPSSGLFESAGALVMSVGASNAVCDVLVRYAAEITPTAVDGIPLPPPTLVKGWDRVGDAAAEYVVGPLQRAVTNIAGAAAGGVVSALGGVLMSPLGAALLLFAAWRVTRR